MKGFSNNWIILELPLYDKWCDTRYQRARDVMSGRWIVVAPAHQLLLFAQLNIGGNFDELPPK